MKPSDKNQHLFNQALLLYQQNRPIEARNILKTYVRVNRNDAKAWHLYAVIEKKQGNIDEALKIALNGVKKNQNFSLLYDIIGTLYGIKNDVKRGEKYLKKACLLDKKTAISPYNLGLIYERCRDYKNAEKFYLQAIARDENYVLAYNNLGVIYSEQLLFEKAEQYLLKSLSLKNDLDLAWHNLTNVYLDMPLLSDKALKSALKAVEYAPNKIEGHMSLARVYGARGEKDMAVSTYRNALDLSLEYYNGQYSGDIWRSLVKYKKYNKNDTADMDDIKGLITLSDKQKIRREDRGSYHFALGKISADLKDNKTSMQQYIKGNEILYMPADSKDFLDKMHRYINKIMEIFTPLDMNEFQGKNDGDEKNKAIFIVGMMRSGSSLLEQILASHSHIHGIGELSHFKASLDANLPCDIFIKPDDALSTLTKNDERAKNIADEYMNRCRAFLKESDGILITDKLLYNFLYIGFIKMILPNAKILHCRRDARDTCLSIFINYFSSYHPYAYDLKSIAEFWNAYDSLMQFWQKKLGNFIYNVDYEKLTHDARGTVRDILSFLELDRQEQCLNFTQSNRAVLTASGAQVRDKIHTKSHQKWREFEQFLSPLLVTLNTNND